MAAWLAMFPGQGSQYVGMAQKLVQTFPYTTQVFSEASDAISTDVLKLCNEGPEDQLALTANTQPCILTTSVAIWKVLQKEAPNFQPEYFAGHSLGEYSALVAAGRLQFVDAVKLVRARGEFMQKAVPAGVGAMAAVLNCPGEDLEKYCQESSEKNSVVEIANYNSPSQLVVAGHKAAVDKLVAKLGEKKIKAIPLKVSAPFHSSLMAPAREAMTPLLLKTNFTNQKTKMIANYSGAATADYGVDYLIRQIDNSVKWTQSLNCAWESGLTHYLEIGPGKVLQGLVKRTLPKEAVSEITDSLSENLLVILSA